ncbi:hypothetical protein ACOMHN_051975 [Nucella lapillus]
MSQMLNSAGGSSQGAGYHGVSQSHTAVTANPSSILSMSTAARSSPLTLSSSQHYGQLSAAQQQQHRQLLQQQQQQQQQQQLQQLQHQKMQAPSKAMSHTSPYQHQLPGGGGAGTPILGMGGSTYRGLLRRNPASGTGAPSSSSGGAQHGAGDTVTSAGGDAVGFEAGGMGVAQFEEEGEEEEEEEESAATPTASKDEKENENLANTKEKTPMCLINELARFNKVNHQYTLVDEQGPAHKKTFFVKLKLGEEEYSAQGESIKKAQHAAAAIALQDTLFDQPSPKPQRCVEGSASNITPTVELNAVAMKRGEPAVYRLIEPRNQNYPASNIDFRGMYNQRYHYGRPPRPFYVMLKVGSREFIGEGPTRQLARHNAAAKALKVLGNLPVPSDGSKAKDEQEEESEDAMKSEISLVHEIALKRNLPVAFEVVRESGPPHMKNFVTKCLVGDLVTEAEGNSKKLSKKRAAEMMLEELRKLPCLPTVLKAKLKPNSNKKKNRNIIKVQKADPGYGVGVNPISRLIQIMQAQKKKEPVYNLVAEKGLPRRREFVMQCQVEEHLAEGVGPNKKLAKRSAAENMLQMLGFSRPSPQPTKPAIKNTTSSEGGSTSDKKVTFVDTGKPGRESNERSPISISSSTMSTGCQVVPGLLRLNNAGVAHIQGLATSHSPHHSHTFIGGDSVSARAESQAVALADFVVVMALADFVVVMALADFVVVMALADFVVVMALADFVVVMALADFVVVMALADFVVVMALADFVVVVMALADFVVVMALADFVVVMVVMALADFVVVMVVMALADFVVVMALADFVVVVMALADFVVVMVVMALADFVVVMVVMALADFVVVMALADFVVVMALADFVVVMALADFVVVVMALADFVVVMVVMALADFVVVMALADFVVVMALADFVVVTVVCRDNVSAVLSRAGPQAESQAVALADFLNIPIKFEEFTKSNSSGEYLTRVTLSTQPPQLYHGTGHSRETSRDAAALSTIQILLALAAPTSSPSPAAGDASSLKTDMAALTRQLNGAGDQI